MITSELPLATRVQEDKASPTRAAWRPFMITLALPLIMGGACTPHLLPAGRRCGVAMSPTLAAPRPLIVTSVLAVAMTYGPQCGTPASPFLAAAGTFYLHQSLKLWHPTIDFIVLRLGMRAWWNLWSKFNHMIESIRYVFIPSEFLQLTRDHDHESVWHTNQL